MVQLFEPPPEPCKRRKAIQVPFR